jgi:hypothetical protein
MAPMILAQEKGVDDQGRDASILVDEKFEGLAQSKVKERHERTKQKHGYEDDDGGIIEFFILGKSLFFGIPRPSGFSEFQNDFAPVFADTVHDLI